MGTGRVVVIGVGNPYRRDDGVGPVVVSLLRDRGLPGVELAESDGEPTRLIELWTGASLAVVVDAVLTRPAHPGRVHRLSAYHPAFAARSREAGAAAGIPGAGIPAASSHGVSLGEAVDLARALDRMPDRLLLLAVEAGDVGFGLGLTPPVAGAALAVADEVCELVGPPLGVS
jgi:hydrogenase maturation protease